MKKRNIILLMLFLVVGFAAVSTTLVINGILSIGFNNTDFDKDVIFTRAESPLGSTSIGETRKEIAFETERIENINQISVLEFDVTNKNRNYDADVTITCGLKEEFISYMEYVTISIDLESPFELLAGETKIGHVTVEMIKAYDEALNQEIKFECKLVATPKERDTLGEEYIDIYKDKVLNGADPVIKDKLVPVKIENNGTVVAADISREWYNYTKKEWANAVILNDGANYNVGETIPEETIESYFVWIPRYKYQIFDEGNYTAQVADSKPTESIAKEIQIEFESKDVTPSTGSTKDSWLTHPAFTNFDVNGLWVGKFETGYAGATSTETAQITSNDSSKVIIKPNTYSWRNNTVSNMFKTAYNYERNLDSHMMKNTEWGAVAYLSHSKYGINTEVRVNNNSNFLTGYAAVDGTDQSSYPGTYGTDATKTLPYNTTTGYKASTTGNITGVYDMSGGAWEYVAGYMPSSQDKSGFISTELTTYSKYLDLYGSNSTITSYNNRILGDATGEMGPFYYYADIDGAKRYHNNWHDDYSYFVDSTGPWFARGGVYGHGVLAGQFDFSRYTGGVYTSEGARLVLAPKI